MMYFEMVLEMAVACGAVYGADGDYHISEEFVPVDSLSLVQMFLVEYLLNLVLMLCFANLMTIYF
jgi:hypothetical protein